MYRAVFIVASFAVCVVTAKVTFGDNHALVEASLHNVSEGMAEPSADSPFNLLSKGHSATGYHVVSDVVDTEVLYEFEVLDDQNVYSNADWPDSASSFSDDLSARYAEIESWALANPQYALEWVTTTASVEEQLAFELLIVYTLLPSNEDILYEYRDYLTLIDSRSVVDRSYARVLAETDPVAAFEWADALAEEESRLAALSVVTTRWAGADHQQVLDRIAMIEDKLLQKHLFIKVSNSIAAALVDSDPANALSWIDTLDEDQKRIALPAVFSKWIVRDPDGARAWLRELPLTTAIEEMIERDFWYSIQHDVEHALAIYSELPGETANRSDYVYSLASSVSRQRPELTELFLASLGDSQLEVAKNAARDQLLFSDPEVYLNLYGSLDAEDRTRHLVSVLTTLEYREPELVSGWLRSHVSDAEISRATQAIREFTPVDSQ